MNFFISCLVLLCLILLDVTAGFSQDVPAGISSSENQHAELSTESASNDYHNTHTSVMAFGGLLTTRNFSELYNGPNNLVDTNLVGLSLSRELFSVGDIFDCRTLDPLKFEIESMGIYHFGNWPKNQYFGEFVLFAALRWHRFPWNNYVLTTFGFGEGASYATEKPFYEIEINDKTAKVLHYLMWDITLAHPSFPELALVLRLHHRSGVFGLIENVTGGSNFFTMGLKYSF